MYLFKTFIRKVIFSNKMCYVLNEAIDDFLLQIDHFVCYGNSAARGGAHGMLKSASCFLSYSVA
jgi:hypothetical protein